MQATLARVLLLSLLLASLTGLTGVSSVAATNAQIHDLKGDGSALLQVEQVNGGVVLRFGEQVIYSGVGNGLAYYQTLVGDLNADGISEAVVVECRKDVSPHIAYYRLFKLAGNTMQQHGSEMLSWNGSLRNLMVNFSGGQQQLLCISRMPEANGLSFIYGYQLLGMSQSGLVMRRQVSQPDQLVSLQISSGQLVEKYARFADGAAYPSALTRRYLTWNGSAFVQSREEQADHYYLEEPNLPELLTRVAREQGIPLEILQAVAAQESNCRQFDYGDYLESPDGGIGIMQVTPRNGQVSIGYLGLNYSGSDLDRLRWDTYFNLQVGAQVLLDKWLMSFGSEAALPRVGSAEQDVLQSWYFALWAYNGYSLRNYPQTVYGQTYQEQVLQRIANLPATGFDQPAFDNWNGGATLPAGGKVLPLQSRTIGTIPAFRTGDQVVLTSAANLRSSAAIYPERIGILGADSRLQILATADEWRQVQVVLDSNGLLTGRTGWVNQSYLSAGSGAVSTTGQVNLRQKPSALSNEAAQNRLSTLPSGSQVQIISGPTFNSYDGHLWYLVQCGSLTGYLAVGSFRLPDDPTLPYCQLQPPVATASGWRVSGSAKPGVTVELYAGDTLLQSTVADGAASFHLQVPSSSEQLSVQAKAIDQRGQRVAWSAIVTGERGLTAPEITTQIGGTSYTQGGAEHTFDSVTVFQAGQGVTVMALHLFRELGATVTYDRGLITIQFGAITAQLRQGQDTMQIADQKGARQVRLRSPVITLGSRTYIPTRDVSENLGFAVSWNGANGSITISTK